MFKLTLPYLTFDYDVDFLLTKQSILHVSIWRYSFYIHITSSIFVLLFGAFQFIPTQSIRVLKIHRVLGKLYVLIIILLSAPSGLVMAFYANGGMWAKISFVSISILWWLFTFLAYTKIRKKNIESHRNYMTRSYALTLSAITLRTYALFLPFFIHLQSNHMYVLIAWISWVPNLLIAELIIKKTN
ncbi:MAG: DUF2306 domain-containing protein [Bacteroidia bacterium]|nr:DUF2306 domain-containing protein [Bacteroidia bacterium]